MQGRGTRRLILNGGLASFRGMGGGTSDPKEQSRVPRVLGGVKEAFH